MVKSNKSNINKILKKAFHVASLLVHSRREAILAVPMVDHAIYNKGE